MPDDTPEAAHVHYDFRDLRPAEARPAQHYAPPVSHLPWEHAETLDALILECVDLFGVARHPRTDASWPRLRARLRQYQILLSNLHREPEVDASHTVIATYLRYVEHYLGQPKPFEPEPPRVA